MTIWHERLTSKHLGRIGLGHRIVEFRVNQALHVFCYHAPQRGPMPPFRQRWPSRIASW